MACALLLGAGGGAWRYRGPSGLLPGILLALAACLSAGGTGAIRMAPSDSVRRVGLLLTGCLPALFVGPRRAPRLDLPRRNSPGETPLRVDLPWRGARLDLRLDFRLTVAVVAGFLLRGAFHQLS